MTSPLELKLNDTSIWAIPSVHFRLAFAEEVNRLCSSVKPDAVAVELGPQTAAAAVAWLRELGIGPGRGSAPLPCMLGLLKPNRRLRASNKEIAVRLQESYGKDLHELTPEVLREYLDYSAFSALPLSSADSIVEAMRCALELDIPLYGIDLEETAARQPKAIMLQDPALAADGFEDYVARNGAFAELQRDEEVDVRRELAMAARLKGLSEKHKRIVFVCGLAHWQSLLTLLRKSELTPAPYPQVTEQELSVIQRVIMHPMMAIYHVDTFPVFSAEYEALRRNASQPRTKYAQAQDWQDVFLHMLQDAYQKKFVTETSGEQLDRVLEDWEARNDFEQLLRNFCLLRQRRIPDCYSALTVAQGVMSKEFCDILAQTFMDIEWAKPDAYPDLPILGPSPSPSATNRYLRAELIERDGRSSKGFFVESLPGRSGLLMNIPIAWSWKDAPPPDVPPSDGASESWVPTEDLINAFLFRATRVAREERAGPHVEAFEGSLLDGVDVKSTLRSAARGEDQIFVRADRRRQIRFSSSDEETEGFPVVWIFRLMKSGELEWKLSVDDLGKLSAQSVSEDWAAAGLATSGYMITSVAAVTDSHEDKELSTPNYLVTTQTIVGKLSFWPQCCERRTAEWALETKLTRNPVARDGTFEGACELYRDRYGLELAESSWDIALIRMAIPFANKAITVVAPDGYVLPRVVHQEAAAARAEVRVVPLSYFPSDAVRRMSHLVFLPVLRREFDEEAQIDVPVYPEHVKRYFNEPMNAYRRLIPAKWH